MVSWTESHLSIPTPATFAAVSRAGADLDRARDVVRAQLDGRTPPQGWLPLDLVGHSKTALAETNGIHLGRALSSGVDRLAQ